MSGFGAVLGIISSAMSIVSDLNEVDVNAEYVGINPTYQEEVTYQAIQQEATASIPRPEDSDYLALIKYQDNRHLSTYGLQGGYYVWTVNGPIWMDNVNY